MTTSTDVVIEARNVHHTYRQDGADSPVLHGIDLTIRRGEFVLLMGPSGCGKTTLLHILGMMMRPTTGQVRVEGHDIGAMSESERTQFRRANVGFVFQRFNLLPILTARGNVELPLRLRGDDVDGQASAVLKQVGLSDKAEKKPRALSIGEQQRIALARAVVTKPRLLLADEPTGNLDSATAATVLNLLAELHKSCGLTTLMITHNEHIAARADRVLTMQDGRIESR